MAHTSCFRREAGSHGRDTRGLVEVHQFQKIELVKFTKPRRFRNRAPQNVNQCRKYFKKLGLHYRVLFFCSKDTSNSSSKTFDIEVWMPGLNRYMEISSVSNFKDFSGSSWKNSLLKSKEGKNQLLPYDQWIRTCDRSNSCGYR